MKMRSLWGEYPDSRSERRLQGRMEAGRYAMVAALLCAGLVSCVIAPPEVVMHPAPPPRVEVIPAPRTGYVWVNGHWRWWQGAYVWEPGHWITVRVGYHWIPGHWASRGSGWVWIDGYWAL